jgi:hypothetical protein
MRHGHDCNVSNAERYWVKIFQDTRPKDNIKGDMELILLEIVFGHSTLVFDVKESNFSKWLISLLIDPRPFE